MTKKNIWIINEYAGTPYHGMEFRHYYLAKELSKEFNITIVSSSYSHLFKKLPTKKKETIDNIDYLWLKTFNYGSSHNKKRVLKWFLFMFKCFFLPFILKKPDIIVVSPMAPFPILPAWIISKMYKSKLIYEVKDIWPLSLIELGGFSRNHPFIKLMSWFEKFALNKSDSIVSNLQNYGEHIKNLRINKNFYWISNGIDLDELKEIESIPNNIIEKIPNDKFIIGYTGTVGVANTLDSFLESSKYVNDNIAFVVVGDGQEKERLIDLYKNNDKIIFIEAVNKKQVQSLLSLFDICFLGWKNEKLYKYGTSANKIFDYMYSGKPILNAYSGKGDLVELYNCGLSVEAQNEKAIGVGIMKLYNMSKEERELLGCNGKKYVLENFTYANLSKKYIKLFKD